MKQSNIESLRVGIRIHINGDAGSDKKHLIWIAQGVIYVPSRQMFCSLTYLILNQTVDILLLKLAGCVVVGVGMKG